MVGWHHQLNGHEFEQAPGVGDGQRSLACCSPCGRKESDTTEQLSWTELCLSLHWEERLFEDIVRRQFSAVQKESSHQEPISQHLDLELAAPRTVRNKFLFLSHPVYAVLSWQPELLHDAPEFHAVWFFPEAEPKFRAWRTELWVGGRSCKYHSHPTILQNSFCRVNLGPSSHICIDKVTWIAYSPNFGGEKSL